ncbi:NUDIX domain-containing protein [Vannielia sp.]|uniref:NUDIX domain-containing protein n=1 Tax=Vannielia sp. TaxID=2813045 RepID=UPI00263822CF|nr:NUDIX domain-containing protein [Vannielia sp.]MDF1873682.1 NUDIX domain-containing protein [Vannielia sp.]
MAIFLYGTLAWPPLLRVVAGEDVRLEPAVLSGWRVHGVRGETHPMITPEPGAVVKGWRLDAGPQVLARLDFYEAVFGYPREPFGAFDLYQPRAAQEPEGTWSLEAWGKEYGALWVAAAGEIMALMGRDSPAEVAARMGVIRARAQAILLAQNTAPTTLRHHAEPGDVEVLSHEIPYAKFFSVEEVELTHRRFDGGRNGPLNRAGFVSVDAATVLPYDPRRDRVMLIEQFRVGPFLRRDPQPWVLEPIAGRIDPGETPEACARREAEEEAGITLEEFIPLGKYYPSPGAKTEFLHAFAAVTDLPDEAAGQGGGVAGEGEDIRSHILSFDEALALIETGEINIGPTMISLLRLGQIRDGLRAGVA